jgi:inorganic pyrophosphatase
MKVFIETLKNSDMRTRYDEATFQRKGAFNVSSPYPYAYGFIIESNKKGEDCLDCYILTHETLVEGQFLDCEPVFLIEVYEGDEEDYKVIMKTAEYEIDNKELVVNTIKSFITRIFSNHPEVKISFGRIIGKEETITLINNHMGR